jgi:predicted TIM-barrel fold metal-dependent hydrolase
MDNPGSPPNARNPRIIDARCRLTIPQVGDYFRNSAAQFGRAPENPATIEGFFAEIEEAGIQTAIAVMGNNPGGRIGKRQMPDRTTSNDLLARLQQAHWGRLLCAGGVDVSDTFHDSLHETERCARLGLRGVFIEPGRTPGWDLDDARLYPLYELCSAERLVLIPQTSGLVGGKSIEYAHPRHIDKVANDFPDLRILAGHACYPFVREAIVVAARHEHVYLSPDTYLFHMGTQDWVSEVNSNHFGLRERFLFGTAFPAGTSPRAYTERFMRLPWNSEALPSLLWGNALRLFGLDADPVYRKLYSDAVA